MTKPLLQNFDSHPIAVMRNAVDHSANHLSPLAGRGRKPRAAWASFLLHLRCGAVAKMPLTPTLSRQAGRRVSHGLCSIDFPCRIFAYLRNLDLRDCPVGLGWRAIAARLCLPARPLVVGYH
jgi:hypothetical protein